MNESYITCPKCGAGVTMSGRSVDCVASCGFRIRSEIAKRKMQPAEIEALLTKKAAGPFSGFISSKTGNQFSAGLRLNEEFQAEFVFAERGAPAADAPKMGCACPKCRKQGLVDDGRVIRCACGFSLWKTVAKKNLTDKQVETLLTAGSVAVKGLKSAAGKSFDATLVLDAQAGKVSFSFG